MPITTLRRLVRAFPTRGAATMPPAEVSVDIDLTRPDWDQIGDLADDFDNKMESFMGFDDGYVGAEREWLTG